MRSSEDTRPNYSRRFFWFALLILLAIAGYSAFWYHFAGRVEAQARAVLAELNTDGVRANCEEPDVRGYPFRIGLFCRSVLYVDARDGIGFRAGAFRSAAQVYDPRHIVGELDGPAVIEIPGLQAIEAEWDVMHASLRLAGSRPQRLSVEGRSVELETGPARATEGSMLHFGTAELHLRPNGTDLDAALRFSGLRLGEPVVPEGVEPAPLDGFADLTVTGGAVPGAFDEGLRNLDAAIRNISVRTTEGAGATLRGDASIDEFGLIDADLQLMVENPQALARFLADLFPERGSEIAMSMAAVAAMGERPMLPLRIDKGDVSLGFLSLGEIPPL